MAAVAAEADGVADVLEMLPTEVRCLWGVTNAAPEDDEAELAAMAASLVGDMSALFVGSAE